MTMTTNEKYATKKPKAVRHVMPTWMSCLKSKCDCNSKRDFGISKLRLPEKPTTAAVGKQEQQLQ